MIIQRNETRTRVHHSAIQDAEEIIHRYHKAKKPAPIYWICEVCGMKHGVIAPDVCDSCGASALAPQAEQHTEIGSRW